MLLGLQLSAPLAIALLLTPAAAQAEDRLLRQLVVATWQGGAYETADGQQLCALWDDYSADDSIWIRRDDSGYALLVTAPDDFDFTSTDSFDLTLRFDEDVIATKAQPLDADRLLLPLGNDPHALNALRVAAKLYLDAFGLWFTLNGTHQAWVALERCYYELP